MKVWVYAQMMDNYFLVNVNLVGFLPESLKTKIILADVENLASRDDLGCKLSIFSDNDDDSDNKYGISLSFDLGRHSEHDFFIDYVNAGYDPNGHMWAYVPIIATVIDVIYKVFEKFIGSNDDYLAYIQFINRMPNFSNYMTAASDRLYYYNSPSYQILSHAYELTQMYPVSYDAEDINDALITVSGFTYNADTNVYTPIQRFEKYIIPVII